MLQLSGVLPSWVSGNPGYSYQLIVTGAAGPLSFSTFVPGDWPNVAPGFKGQTGFDAAGLILDPTTGLITGTPTAVGSYFFSISVTDGVGIAYLSTGIEIFASGGPLAIVQDAGRFSGAIGFPYGPGIFRAAGGAPPYTWSVHAGSPPAGLALAASGELSGTPTGPAGPTTFTVRVTDSAAAHVDVPVTISIGVDFAGFWPQLYSFTFSEEIVNPPVLDCNNPPPGRVGDPYSHQLVATGGSAPYVSYVLIAGSLPPGLNLNALTGLISGKPTLYGTYSFTVQVTDSLGATGPVNCSITIYPNQYLFGSAETLVCDVKYPWLIPPGQRTPWKADGSIVAPAVGVIAQIFEYQIPDNFYLVVDRIQHAFAPSGLFVDGTGAVIWLIDINSPLGSPLATWRPVGQFTGMVGKFGKPFPVGPLQFRGGDVLRYKVIVTDPAVPVGPPNVVSAYAGGWLYPVTRLGV